MSAASTDPWRGDSRLRRLVRAYAASRTARFGFALLVGFAVVAAAAPYLAPCPPSQLQHCGEDPYRVPRYGFSGQPLPPSRDHLFGTTPKQHDIYYGTVWGTRTAYKVGLLITLPALLFGITVGAVAGYYGGWVDEVLMRGVDIFLAFPFFIAAVTVATVLHTSGLSEGTLPAMTPWPCSAGWATHGSSGPMSFR